MKQWRKVVLLIEAVGLIVLAGLASGLWVASSAKLSVPKANLPSPVLLALTSASPTISPSPAISLAPPSPIPIDVPTPQQSLTTTVSQQVPFTVQAPLAQWHEPMFQDACEEASVLMAMAWAEAVSWQTPTEATAAIVALADWQQRTTGEFRDRSAADTAQLIRDYFGYAAVKFVPDITTDDIVVELLTGNLVIVPVNGQALGNPHFTPPGPERHMLVLTGWDPATKTFITNDPGTRLGAAYRYDKGVLYSAIRDYETGYHVPIVKIKKSMIVVSKP